MTHHTLAEIAAKFGRLDGVEDDQHAQFEKGLRNLVQRHYLPPTTQQGRIFLYDAAAAVTIRLAQIASEFGMSRPNIETLARWLSASGERKAQQGSGWRGILHAEEAIQRAEAGEEFSVHVIMRSDLSVIVKADWKADREIDPKSAERAANALRSIGKEAKPEVARFSLPASRLVQDILPALKG